MKRYKIVSPVRFFISILVITMIMAFGIATLFGGNTTEAASVNTYAQVEVQPEDTLWSIASVYADDSVDLRQFIKEIREINDIDNDESIHVGDQLFIPTNN